MQTALISPVPAAPAHGIGSSIAGGGAADSEAAATAFAGLLAAMVPSAPSAAAVAPPSAPCAKAVPLTVASASALPQETTSVSATGDAGGAATTSVPTLATAPAPAPSVEQPSGLLSAANPDTSANAAVPAAGAPLAAVAAPAAATDATAAVTPAPSAVTVAAAAAGVPPVADGRTPVSGTATVADPLAAAPRDGAAPAVTAAEFTLQSGESAASQATPNREAHSPLPETTDSPGAGTTATATAPTRAPGLPGLDFSAAGPERPVAILSATQATATEAAVAAAAGEPDLIAPEAVDGDSDAPKPAPESEAADAPESPPTAEPMPAALQALLGLGLQTYLKADNSAGVRPPAVTAADAAVAGEQSTAPASGVVANGRPTAFAAAVDGALNSLSGGDDASSEDPLTALTRGGRNAPARTADAALAIRSQVADQVVRGLTSNTGENKLTIRLDPESLGRVDVDFKALDDHLTVVLRASTPEAERALRAGARELTDGILDRAARYQHVEVRVELREGATVRLERQDERQQDQRQDGRRDGRQDSRQDGRRDGRDDGRGQRTDDGYDGARSAWARAMADLSQEV